ncbi:MAG: hypothetical protein ACHQZR_07995 [Candidatus Limnocylindrales bacterium]
MDEELPGVIEAALAAMRAGDGEALAGLRTADHVERWPQSGESVQGRERLRELQAAYPGGLPALGTVRRVAGRDELWTIEGRSTYPDGRDWFVVAILELNGERIAQTTTYFCEPFPAPPWRAAHVVPFDPQSPPAQLAPAGEPGDAEMARLGERYGRASAVRDWDELRRMRGAGWSVEWPQSGERIPNHEADVAIHGAYPGFPEIATERVSAGHEGWELSPLYTRVRVHGAGPLLVVEGANTYASGERWLVVALLEVGDGHIRRETYYFGQPFEAPAWRARWVEPFDPLAPR